MYGGIVQIAPVNDAVLGGDDQGRSPPPPVAQLLPTPLPALQEEVVSPETTTSPTLTETVKQPAKVKRFPMWAIIVIAMVGAVAVFSVLGVLMHRGGKKMRQNRVKRRLLEKETTGGVW